MSNKYLTPYFFFKAAGIEEKMHAHMFRYQFITKLFVSLIERQAFENTNDFRQELLDIETLKQKLQQYIGRTKLYFLYTYIHLAFEDVVSFKKTYDVISLSGVVESAPMQVGSLDEELSEGKELTVTMRNFKQLLNSFKKELKVEHREM